MDEKLLIETLLKYFIEKSESVREKHLLELSKKYEDLLEKVKEINNIKETNLRWNLKKMHQKWEKKMGELHQLDDNLAEENFWRGYLYCLKDIEKIGSIADLFLE